MRLATELRAREPGVEIFGLGGERLASSGADVVAHYRDISVTGLTEALRVVPDSLRLLRTLTDEAARRRPDVFVAIDFPDFNFRLMARLAKLGVPIVYYISPQLWAWRTGRMRTMRRLVSKVLVIFPFEEEIYARAGVPVQFVGHPLVEMSTMAVAGFDRQTFLQDLGLSTRRARWRSCPAAGQNELSRHIPVLADAMRARWRRGCPTCSSWWRARRTGRRACSCRSAAWRSRCGRPLVTVRDATDAVLAASDVAITASGTATVQCAIHRRPMVVIYKLSGLSHALLRPFVRVDAAAMPNLVAGRAHRARTDPGRVHAGAGGGRSRGAADRRRRARPDARGARRRARKAEPAGRERAAGRAGRRGAGAARDDANM